MINRTAKNAVTERGIFRRCQIWTAAGKAAKLMTLQARSKARRKARIKLYIKKKLPHPAESKKPWYVEFPEDREAKQRGKVFEQPKVQPTYKVYNEPAFITPPSLKKRPAAPVFAMPRTQKKAALFNGKINRRRLREGIIMAEILDKPRALRPYKEPY